MLCLDVETQGVHLCPLRTAILAVQAPQTRQMLRVLQSRLEKPPVQYARLRPCTTLAWNVIWSRVKFMQQVHIA